MKRLFALLLALLLLCGCAPAANTADTAAPTAEPLSGLPDLTADTVLLYRQADFAARQGTLVPMDTVLSAPEEDLLPRTHLYDDRFPGDAALWLRLLDYAFANGYQGFSVPAGTLPAPNADQYRALALTYRIDYGKVLTQDGDGATTAWIECAKADTMEKFSLGLAKAREIAAEAPRGDDWETAAWVFAWLEDHVAYGDRDTYYFKRGHQLCDALVDGDCVCSGYADAMYYLCNLCGVECICLEGMANSPDKAGGLDDHVWNLARLYGEWYVFDPTADDTVPMEADVPLCFGFSSSAMQSLNGNKPVDIYADAKRIPVCEHGFDPVSAWNGNPEGALRSWLWFGAYNVFHPLYLLAYADLWTPDTVVTPSADGTRGTAEISWTDFAAWAGRFMSEDAARPFFYQYSASEDGMLTVAIPQTPPEIDWAKLTVLSVTEENGVYTADLGGVTAVFTVSQTDEGLYRIETVELR